jgi:hypothetical protein
MASSIFGGIANAIDGGPKLNPVYYSGPINDQINQLTLAQTGNRAANDTDLARLNAEYLKAGGEVAKMAPGDQAIIASLVKERTDPFATYQNVGNFNVGLLDRLASNLATQGQAGESRRMAALGYGGRGDSTYGSNTLLDRISKNLAPVYANTIATTGRDASAIDAGRIAQNQNTVGLLNYRANIPGRALDYYAAPITARNQVTDAEIAQLLGLGTAAKANTAGFREKQTALGSIAGSLDSAVDTGMSLYGGGMLKGVIPGGGNGSAPSYGGGSYGGNSPAFSFGGYTSPQNMPSYGAGLSYNSWTPPWRN